MIGFSSILELVDFFPGPWPWHEQGENSWWDSATWGWSCAWVGSVGGSTCGPCCEDREKLARGMGTSVHPLFCSISVFVLVCYLHLSTILFISPYLILSTLSLCHAGPPRARNVEDVLALMRLEIWDPASFISSSLCAWWATFWYRSLHTGCPISSTRERGR